ncbi:MAG: hypothetical protein JJE52_18845 [Acidimicrobiia bacterium]|nr:hypothetical protein [Acidimicrobiia bacterium]
MSTSPPCSVRIGNRGSITAFVAVVATALVLVAGMAYDGGQVLAAHAAARSHAAKASRAGAQQIDLDHLRDTGEPVLIASAAETAALDYLDRVDTTGTVTIDAGAVTVTVTVTQPMLILPVPDRHITATATADAVEEATP